uniref:dTDP-4-dehydrorhamnose reductase n=1 Tax=Polaribacter sp. TaxID=1920175 RepID=UPI004047D7E1
MRVLVTGAHGQLGSELKDISSNFVGFQFFFACSELIDVRNYKELETYVLANKIEAIINCAAYTQVDKAEIEADKAEEINSLAVINLAKVIQKIDGKIIHISTDYVFDGTNFKPYTENDVTNPLGIYGKTKLKGEEVLKEFELNGIVIRTSWLYSEFGANFVKTMLRLGEERSELGVIFDQLGTPTNAKDLAFVCLQMLSSKECLNDHGFLYHYSNEGVASWYDFAKAIFEFANIDCKINPIETKDYPTPAKRPFYSVLNKHKVKKDFDIEIPYWRDSLKTCINSILRNPRQ